MSKKTRKKSPKTSRKSVAAAKASVRSPKAAKARTGKTGASRAAKSKKSASPPRIRGSQTAASKPLRPSGEAGPAIGSKAPAFRLPRDGGESVSLSDFAGRKLVVFFYPRANTPGCTREAIDFTRLRGEFASAGASVLGVSADPVKAQDSFRDKHQLGIPLISDERHEMLEAYGAWGEKSLYGRKFMGIIRTTVLIDGGGRIARVWRNVRVDGHADEVLAAARAL